MSSPQRPAQLVSPPPAPPSPLLPPAPSPLLPPAPSPLLPPAPSPPLPAPPEPFPCSLRIALMLATQNSKGTSSPSTDGTCTSMRLTSSSAGKLVSTPSQHSGCVSSKG